MEPKIVAQGVMDNPIVIMVSGWGGPGVELKISTLKSQIESVGIETTLWQAPLNGWGDINVSARKLADVVFKEAFENNRSVWLLGHSLGGLIAYEASKASPVQGVISIASPHHGTSLAALAPFSTSARQMRPYTPFILDHLTEDLSFAKSFLNVACTIDPIVSAASAIHPKRTDEFITPDTHLSVLMSKRVAEHVTDYLVIKTGWTR